MDQGYIVIAGDDVAQGGQSLLNPLDADRVRQAVPDMLQLLVCRVVGHQKPVAVPWRRGHREETVRGSYLENPSYRYCEEGRDQCLNSQALCAFSTGATLQCFPLVLRSYWSRDSS